MIYKLAHSGSEFVADLSGDLSFSDYRDFQDVLKKMAALTAKSVVLSINKLSSIDSAGIGMFLIAAEQAEKNGQMFSVLSPSGQVERILKLADLKDVLNVVY